MMIQTSNTPLSISEFFRGRSILLTGGSGFLGKGLMEKLLRSCPDICTIYLLLRSKKGKEPETRLQELFQSPLFSRLIQENASCMRKVKIVEGDLTQKEWGLNQSDVMDLRSTVSVIFHSAATIRFTEPLRTATITNIEGTKIMLELAKTMPNIKAVVYISTAFSQCSRNLIEEKVYPVSVNPETLIDCTKWMTEDMMESIAPFCFKDWPNSYTFTKACAEYLVDTYKASIPVVILRPGIVLGSWREPLEGFVDSFAGPGGCLSGLAVGLVRTLPMRDNYEAEVVPLDYTVNAIIAAAWEKGIKGHFHSATDVYNFVSGPRNPVSWMTVKTVACEILRHEAPCPGSMWYPTTWHSSRTAKEHKFWCALLHLLPALVFDTASKLLGNTPRLSNFYKRLHEISEGASFCVFKRWRITDRRVQALNKSLSEEDRVKFYFDVADVNWPSMLRAYSLGIRHYLLQEDPSSIPEAKRQHDKLRCIHYSCVSMVYLLLMYGLYTFLRLVLAVATRLTS